MGRRDGRSWVTVVGTSISSPPSLTPTDPPQHPHGVELVDGSVDSDAWQDVVAEAVRRISAGQLDKVVLARDLVAELDTPLDVRSPLRRLARDYPGCWTFHVDGFFGSTPEMLVRLERGLVTSRVLAGTIRRTGDDTRDLALAASLARSSKDLEEHEYAVRSVAEALAPHCSSTNVPDAPFVLHLPNVMHLATDVTAVLRGDASALNLVAALHPSAAVGGTPTDAAVALIAASGASAYGRRSWRTRAAACACSRAAASSPTRCRPTSWPRARPSSSPCATPWPEPLPFRTPPGRSRAENAPEASTTQGLSVFLPPCSSVTMRFRPFSSFTVRLNDVRFSGGA